jgi:hypothetical protein
MAESSQKALISFTTEAGTFTVEMFNFKNLVLFERKFNLSADVLETNTRLEYIGFCAWASAVDKGLPVAETFDGFLDEIIEIELVENPAGQDQNPTDEGQSAEL